MPLTPELHRTRFMNGRGSQKPGKGVQKYLLKISQGMMAKVDKMSMDVNYEISVKSMMIEIFAP